MTNPQASFLAILLHGVGSNGADLAPLGTGWQSRLPDVIFVSPNAPEPSDFGSGYQWFSVAGVTEENRPARITTARPSFDAVISTIIEEHGFADRLDRVVLVGFSQGTIMSLDAVANGRWPVRAVIGFSGRLATEKPLTPAKATDVLLVHGTSDAIIPSWETEKAQTELIAAGMTIDTIIEPGLGHTISIGGADRACDFLEKLVEAAM
ncbi:prolyl oligopeptidase family serine peptidase [Rhizobiales bacterium RZME27]|uniref:Prolyl oligopeptidase family serine peptidase n=1 Tax=Endobacterium cereale TaxID=2663029 RepID=A0A6A8A220_9HYPH|nr:prolyl oligopeptidase family serine peptidase [Endobacterium cereale]MEB2844630.1 prolyl oligopeptidase family serine peptidase [Endobacterium cereale]MQY45055.1 prolyl oligopeptidase family serine peptidase [Endobacterium cereale]